MSIAPVNTCLSRHITSLSVSKNTKKVEQAKTNSRINHSTFLGLSKTYQNTREFPQSGNSMLSTKDNEDSAILNKNCHKLLSKTIKQWILPKVRQVVKNDPVVKKLLNKTQTQKSSKQPVPFKVIKLGPSKDLIQNNNTNRNCKDTIVFRSKYSCLIKSYEPEYIEDFKYLKYIICYTINNYHIKMSLKTAHMIFYKIVYCNKLLNKQTKIDDIKKVILEDKNVKITNRLNKKLSISEFIELILNNITSFSYKLYNVILYENDDDDITHNDTSIKTVFFLKNIY